MGFFSWVFVHARIMMQLPQLVHAIKREEDKTGDEEIDAALRDVVAFVF